MSGPTAATGRAHARVALLGNPSDGFGGKTIAALVRDFAAEVVVEPSARSEPSPSELVRAAVKRFREHCGEIGARADDGVAISWRTDIPRQVGLGGSSAIVIATLRGLCAHHGVAIEPERLAELALAAEAEELGIPAGPQDRVVQALEGLVYMDFGERVETPYERLDPGLLPRLFLAYRTDAAESSAAVHSGLRRRFERGDPEVSAGMREIAALAERGRAALLAGDHAELGRMMEANVEDRARMVALDPRHARMIESARSLGCPANYAGSGGAIVGLLTGSMAVEDLRPAFAAEGCEVIVPTVG